MADLPNLPLLFDRRKIETSLREAGQFTFFNLTSTDDNAVATGNNQATAYPIRAANTYFSSCPAGSGCVLPQTSCPTPLDGLIVYITNADPVNNLLCYPHPNDPNNSINQLATNAPVVLGPKTMTPFVAFNSLSETAAGKWIADGIGSGAAGSVATIIPQTATGSTTHTQAGATPITQALVFLIVNNANDAFVLMPAAPGLSVQIFNTSTNAPQIWPAAGDQINTLGINNVFTGMTGSGGASPSIIFGAGATGQWWTK